MWLKRTHDLLNELFHFIFSLISYGYVKVFLSMLLDALEQWEYTLTLAHTYTYTSTFKTHDPVYFERRDTNQRLCLFFCCAFHIHFPSLTCWFLRQGFDGSHFPNMRSGLGCLGNDNTMQFQTFPTSRKAFLLLHYHLKTFLKAQQRGHFHNKWSSEPQKAVSCRYAAQASV